MKKSILLLLIIVILVGGGAFYFIYTQVKNAVSTEVVTTSNDNVRYKYTYFQNASKDIYGVFFNTNVKLVYDTSLQKTVREISKENNFTISVNGGYFTNAKTYAGLLLTNGVQQSPISFIDNQVTGAVVINQDSLTIIPIESVNLSQYTSSDYTVFQTGPIVISENQINTEDIKRSANGETSHFRTILGYTNAGEKFFAITTKEYTLTDLANELLSLNVFKGKILNVINLDGGSSTFIYSSENKDYNIGTFKTLPIILGVE